MHLNDWPMKPGALTLAAYTAYPWENALPKLRLIQPAIELGMKILPGYDYGTGSFTAEAILEADAVYIQRDFPRYRQQYAQLKEACAEYKKPIIFDIDDLLFEQVEFPTQDEKDYYRPAVGSILDAIFSAQLVTTSTHYLKEKLEKLASNVIVVPNFIDQNHWDFQSRARNDAYPLVIGYVGTRSHLRDLEQLAGVIDQILVKFPNQIKFNFWIESLPSRLMKYSNVIWKSISLPDYDEYAMWLQAQKVDIWLAPLSDTPFNRAKSPIKYLEYSSMAVPGIFSSITPYQSIVKQGQNGFLADTPDDWVRTISLLIEDSDLRWKLGTAAQKTVKDDWTLQRNLSPWEEVINQLPDYKQRSEISAQRVYHAFTILENQYSNVVEEKNLLTKKADEQRWLVADREDFVQKYLKLQLSFFFRVRRVFHILQAKFFPISSTRGRVLSHLIQKGLQIINRADPPANTSLKNPALGKFPITPPISLSQPLRLALYTTDNWDTASAHIRLIGPAQNLNSGIKILDGCQSSTSANLEFYSNADAVVIQRDFPRHEQAYKNLIAWASQNNKPILYEIDDMLYDIPEDHPEKWYYRSCENLIRSAISDAHAVITSTQPLAEQIRKINPNTWFLPNYLDDNIWRLAKVNEETVGDRITIGYMAGITKTHVPDFNFLIDLLVKFLTHNPDKIELHFWGGVDETRAIQPHIVYHSEKFPSYKKFAAFFSSQKVDVFVAPLSSSPFNHCKSAIKFLEYSSLGVPGVYSDVPAYQDVIRHGENGYLAASLDEWEACIQKLIDDADLRKRIGSSAYKTVCNQYLMSRHASEWERTYTAAIMASY